MKFDTSKPDSQSTEVQLVNPQNFNFEAYAQYEKSLLERTGAFWQASQGVLVYRRMRAAEVFSYSCCDFERSLQLQLGCLEQSMKFKADVPNFLEPWYGIGTTASAFGIDYVWNKGLAPAVHSRFATLDEAMDFEPIEIAKTAIGKRTLEMIEYFLEQTKGRLPISYCDAQSPLNASTMIVDNSSLLLDLLMRPEMVQKFFDKLADLSIDFVETQKRLIGNCLASPGHGFASARNFEGYGQSDDNVVMISNDDYVNCALPSFGKVGKQFGGSVFHSCGDWSDKIDAVKQIAALKMVDGAFSAQTDPCPNPAKPFANAFAKTGIVVNARIVGDLPEIEKTVSELWKTGMKLIVVTYCSTPDEQQQAYDKIYSICR